MKSFQILAYTLLMFASSAASAATDLDLDAGFGANGSIFVDFSDGQGSYDVGMRSFKECNKAQGVCAFPLAYHHYVAGIHNHGSTQDAAITLISDAGVPIASFGTAGKLTVPTSMSAINDVAFDPGTDRLYFVGAQRLFSTTSLEFGVFCLDLPARAPCGNFGNVGNGTQLVVFDLGGSNEDVATRVLFDPQGYLYVAGYADATNGSQVAVTKLSAANGAPIAQFAGSGHAGFVLGNRPTGQAVSVSGMALMPASFQGIALDKLYVVGSYKTSFDDNDGYVLALDAENGTYVNARTIAYESDNPFLNPHGNDSVTAITVLANGKLAVAGYSDTTTLNQPALLMARMQANSSLALDTGFCGSGICVEQVGDGTLGWRNTYPIAIAERPNTRDLVVGMQATVAQIDFVTSQIYHVQKQVVQQYAANGGTLHAEAQIQFPAADATTLVVRSSGMNVSNSSVELVGWRAFTSSPSNLDFTMSRMLANDTIFADQFGGAHSD